MIINSHDQIVVDVSDHLLDAWVAMSKALKKLTPLDYSKDDPFYEDLQSTFVKLASLSTAFETEWKSVIDPYRKSLFPPLKEHTT
jgi:hypothetical protein